MKLLIASDSFKGSLSSQEIGNIFKRSDDDKVITISDGGEGFVESILHNDNSFKAIKFKTTDSKGNPIIISGATKEKSIYLDVASIVGLHQYPKISASKKTTEGLGKVLKEIEDSEKFKEVFIGLGGSSTNDLGFYAACELGFKFIDKNNKEITSFEDLANLADIKRPNLKCKYVGFADVVNPLIGEYGATNVFGPQKWMSKDDLQSAESIFKSVSSVVKNRNHLLQGAGAAGGLGYFVIEFLKGNIEPGINKIIETSNIKNIIPEFDYVITGEGVFDNQSFFGKVPIEIAKLSKGKTILVAGSIKVDQNKLDEYFVKTFQIMKEGESVKKSIDNTYIRLKEIAKRIRDE